jgi:hypothetical protein
VNASRVAFAGVPGEADAMRANSQKEAAFLARFGITREQFRYGLPAGVVEGEWAKGGDEPFEPG